MAGVPWLLSSCSPRPLLPHQLKEERAQYETRAASAQQATLEAQRAATSAPPRVVSIGTVKAADVVSTTTSEVATYTATLTVTSQLSPSLEAEASHESVLPTFIPTATLTTPLPANSTVKILNRSTVSQTGTPISTVIVVRSTQVANSQVSNSSVVTGTPVPEKTATISNSAAIPTVNALGMKFVEDVITEDMLSEQVKTSNEDGSLSDVVIHITSQGLRATGKIQIAPILQRPFEMSGTFIIENESLAIKVESISLNGNDVTAQYGSDLEDDIRWELYQLLPQRFVQSFTLEDGQITVQSFKR